MAKDWICPECGHEVVTPDDNPPQPIRWTDGHVCEAWMDLDEAKEQGYTCPDDFSALDPASHLKK